MVHQYMTEKSQNKVRTLTLGHPVAEELRTEFAVDLKLALFGTFEALGRGVGCWRRGMGARIRLGARDEEDPLFVLPTMLLSLVLS